MWKIGDLEINGKVMPAEIILIGGENMEKFVRCEKCGAMVKVLIDCTCGDCGINVVMRQ